MQGFVSLWKGAIYKFQNIIIIFDILVDSNIIVALCSSWVHANTSLLSLYFLSELDYTPEVYVIGGFHKCVKFISNTLHTHGKSKAL